jgi:hypothetical protein
LQHVLKTCRAWLLAHPEYCLNDSEQAYYAGLLQRRLCGEPIAYMLDEREFFKVKGVKVKGVRDISIFHLHIHSSQFQNPNPYCSPDRPTGCRSFPAARPRLP